MGLTSFPANLRAVVSRLLPQLISDTTEISARADSYGGVFTQPRVRKHHVLVDEGSYFIANNANTGVATAAAPTAYSDTAPLLTIFNTSAAGGKRIYLDFIRMVETAAGTAGTGVRLQLKLDSRNNYSSGGTSITGKNPADGANDATAQTFILPTAVAVSASSKMVVPDLLTVLGATAPIAVSSMVEVNFGAVEKLITHIISTTTALAISQAPPIVIPPGYCLTVNFIITAQSAASSWDVNVGYWVA